MRALVVVGLVVAGACVAPDEHRCVDDRACDGRAGGRCEPTGYCSFTDVAGCARGYPPGGPLAGTCVAADLDSDGDGVGDDRDNCPQVANPDQHDEDGDARGDLCDGCPATPDPLQANADGDDLGDACDPRDGDKPNHLVLFDPLTPASAAAWTLATGLAFDRDELVASSDQALGYRGYRLPAGDGLGDTIFVAEFDLATVGPSGVVGVVAPVGAAVVGGCVVEATSPATLVLIDVAGAMVTQEPLAAFAAPLGPGALAVAYWPGVVGGTTMCAARLADADQVGGATATISAPNLQVGVLLQDATARVRYLYGYTP